MSKEEDITIMNIIEAIKTIEQTAKEEPKISIKEIEKIEQNYIGLPHGAVLKKEK